MPRNQAPKLPAPAEQPDVVEIVEEAAEPIVEARVEGMATAEGRMLPLGEPSPPPEAAPPPAAATAEEWATRKGMLPQRLPVHRQFARKGAAPADEPNPLFEKYAQARAHFAWREGKELSEAEFDAAVTEATTHIYR